MAENQEIKSVLTKKDIRKAYNSWHQWAEVGYSYERMQGIGMCRSQLHILERLYQGNPKGLKKALKGRFNGTFCRTWRFSLPFLCIWKADICIKWVIMKKMNRYGLICLSIMAISIAVSFFRSYPFFRRQDSKCKKVIGLTEAGDYKR